MGNTVGYYSMIHAEAERLHGILSDASAARALNRENLIQDAQNRAATYNDLATGALNIASNMWGAFTGQGQNTQGNYNNQGGYPQQNQGYSHQGYGQQQSNYGNQGYGQQGNPAYGNQGYGNSSFGSNVNPYGVPGGYPGQQPTNPYGQNPYGQNPYGQNPYGNNPYGGNQGGYNPYGGY